MLKEYIPATTTPITAALALATTIALALILVAADGRAWAAPDKNPSAALLQARIAEAEEWTRTSTVSGQAVDATELDAWIDRILSDLDAEDQNDPFAVIDACMEKEMRERGAAGASMAIAQNGELVHARAMGVKSRAEGGAVDTETIFRINSTTKMMTGAAVLQEVQKGHLNLQAPLTDYIPDLRLQEPWDPSAFTLHSLLSNTGALPDPYIDFSLYPQSVEIPSWDKSIEDWASLLKYAQLYAPPGSFWNYSSPNFSLAALALERETGRGYSEYVTNELWRPAGMQRTTFDPAEAVATGNYSAGYYQGNPYTLFDFDRPYAHPGGGAYSTPSELITWAQVLFGQHEEILSSASIQAMTTPWVESEGSPSSPMTHYGYGVWVDDYRPVGRAGVRVTVLEHSGRGRGFATEFHWIPERGFAIAILVNEVASMLNTARCALRELEGLEIAPDPGLNTPVSEWDRYTGTYNIFDVYGDSWTARVAREGGGMQIEFPDRAMLPAAADLFGPTAMSPRFLDTFNYPAEQGGTVTFEDADANAPHARWMRSQYRVGQRVGEMPPAIEVEGSNCSPLNFRSGLDTEALSIRAYGLNETIQLQDQNLAQDNPDDPASTKIRIDLEARDDVGFIATWLADEEDDDLDLLLMQDQNLDGSFAWPEELVDRMSSSPTQGMFVAARNEAGPYQLWVHGVSVVGANSRFDLDIVLLAGEDLRLEDVPRTAKSEQSLSLDVCGPEGRPYENPRIGIVEFDFGVPHGIVRVPVHWEPGAEPEPNPRMPGILLPLLFHESR